MPYREILFQKIYTPKKFIGVSLRRRHDRNIADHSTDTAGVGVPLSVCHVAIFPFPESSRDGAVGIWTGMNPLKNVQVQITIPSLIKNYQILSGGKSSSVHADGSAKVTASLV